MRGLTDTERERLAWYASPGESATYADQPPDIDGVLYARGLLVRAVNPPEDEYEYTDTISTIGELALRVDAAARKAGVGG